MIEVVYLVAEFKHERYRYLTTFDTDTKMWHLQRSTIVHFLNNDDPLMLTTTNTWEPQINRWIPNYIPIPMAFATVNDAVKHIINIAG